MNSYSLFHEIMNNLHFEVLLRFCVSSKYVLQFTLIAEQVGVDALCAIENYPSTFNTNRWYSFDAIKLRLYIVDAWTLYELSKSIQIKSNPFADSSGSHIIINLSIYLYIYSCSIKTFCWNWHGYIQLPFDSMVDCNTSNGKPVARWLIESEKK